MGFEGKRTSPLTPYIILKECRGVFEAGRGAGGECLKQGAALVGGRVLKFYTTEGSETFPSHSSSLLFFSTSFQRPNKMKAPLAPV